MNVQLVFEKKIKSVVKIDSHTIQKLMGIIKFTNEGTINRMGKINFF